MRKNKHQNSEKKIFAKSRIYVNRYTAGHLCTKFHGFILNDEANIARNVFDLLLGAK